VTIDIERELRLAMTAITAAASDSALSAEAVRYRVRQRHRRRLVMRSAMACGVVATVFSVAATGHEDADDTSIKPMTVPAGDRVELTPKQPWLPLSPLDKPHSSTTFGVAGRFTITVWTSMFVYAGNVVQQRCVSVAGTDPVADAGTTNCDQFKGKERQTTTRATLDDPVLGPLDLWLWSGLSTDVAYVEFQDGDSSSWEQPIDGVVAFVTKDRQGRTAGVSYDRDGNEIDRVSPLAPPPGGPFQPSVNPKWEHLSQADREALPEIASDALTDCLSRYNSPDDAEWEGCLPRVQAAVNEWLAARA
jgi:hypothetical protein